MKATILLILVFAFTNLSSGVKYKKDYLIPTRDYFSDSLILKSNKTKTECYKKEQIIIHQQNIIIQEP